MSANNESPTPEEREAIKKATTFAYGYSLMMYNGTGHAHYYTQSENLKADLKLFGCFGAETNNLKDDYFDSFSKGSDKAVAELEEGNR